MSGPQERVEEIVFGIAIGLLLVVLLGMWFR